MSNAINHENVSTMSEQSYQRSRQTTVRRRWAITTALTELISVSIAGIAISVHRSNEVTARKEISAIKADGFTGVHDVSDGRIGTLILNNCSFHQVDFETKMTSKGSFWSQPTFDDSDVTSYSMAIGTLQPNTKFEQETVTLKFTDAKQLQAELPSLNCSPQ